MLILLAKNNEAFESLVDEHKVKLRRLPNDVLWETQGALSEGYWRSVSDDPLIKRALDPIRTSKTNVRDWHKISEVACSTSLNSSTDTQDERLLIIQEIETELP